MTFPLFNLEIHVIKQLGDVTGKQLSGSVNEQTSLVGYSSHII